MTTAGLLVGSYAAAPPDPESPDFAELLQLLAAHTLVGGLEVPSHQLTGAAATAIAAAAPAAWTFAVTSFPGTMLAINADPAVGLASTDATGRATAITRLAEFRETILRFDKQVGGGRVSQLFLHSSPRGGSADALAASLAEVTSWDWSGVELAIEHSDAAVPSHPAEKGFLSLDDELAALQQFPDIGIVINWARSAIETRSADGPADQLTALKAADRLAGLMFSGVAAIDNDFGGAWTDGHLPTATVSEASLLTTAEIDRCVAIAGPSVPLGIKMCTRPQGAPTSVVIQTLNQALTEVDAARNLSG